MKVVILCGGKGTRLHEETAFRPKPLVEIGGRPILWHVMKIFAHQGYKEFVLLLGHHGEMIREYFVNYPTQHGDFLLRYVDGSPVIAYDSVPDTASWSIEFVDTGIETQTGARVVRARRFLHNDDFFLTYADGVADIDLRALRAAHQSLGCAVTVTGVRQRIPYGLMTVEGGKVISFQEKPFADGLINGGYFVCTSEIFDHLSMSDSCVLEEEPLRSLAAQNQLGVYEHPGFWAAMDTHKQFLELNRLWEINPPWRVWEPKAE